MKKETHTRTDKNIKDFYTTYGDRITEKRLNSPYKLRRYAHVAQYNSILAHVGSGMRVLDAGCGEGTLAIMMAKKGAKVTGCDLSEPNIENARMYAKESDVIDIQFIAGDSEHLPFGDNEFDLVVSSHVLEHLPDFDAGLKEVMRVTKKRAVIAIPTVINLCSLVQVGGGSFFRKNVRSFVAFPKGLLRAILALVRGEEGVDETYGGADVPHVFRFPRVMIHKIEKYGFHLIAYEAPSICFPYFELFLPLIRFLDKFKSKKGFRNCGYGTTFVVEK